jgi:hypothetical protein
MIELREKGTTTVIGTITEEQLQALSSEMEAESSTDRDYYLTRETLEMLEDDGVDPTLVQMLRRAMGSRTELEIEWG